MRIFLKLRPCSPALATRLAGDPALARTMGATPNAAVGFLFGKFFDAAGPVLPQVLAQARGEAVSFLRDLQFTAAELDAASHLEVVCKATVAQTRPDADATRAQYLSEPLQAGPGDWAVRLPQRIYLSKPVPAQAICHVDQWTGEHVLGAGAVDALQASGLAGFELRPVLHPRTGAAHPGAMHLGTRHLLPPVMADATWWASWDDGPHEPATPRRHGLLPYEAGALDASPDFARTAEPWGEWCTPVWVVRQSVRQWFARAGLRGWGFRPVLVRGTPLHDAHTAQWARLVETLRGAGASVLA